MYYMVGGTSKKNLGNGMEWIKTHPDDSRVLLKVLTGIVIEYASAQVRNGAHVVQIFEAMGMMIKDDDDDDAGKEEENMFEEWCTPCLEEIAVELKRRHPDIPLMVFARGAW